MCGRWTRNVFWYNHRQCNSFLSGHKRIIVILKFLTIWCLHLGGFWVPVGSWPQKRGECPGMSPGHGKYLAGLRGQHFEKRKEMRFPLSRGGKKSSYLARITLHMQRCERVCVANSSARVCEGWTGSFACCRTLSIHSPVWKNAALLFLTLAGTCGGDTLLLY